MIGAFNPTPIATVPGYNQGEGETRIEFTIPIATAQAWVDDPASFAGIVLASNDLDGDSRSRFNFFGNPAELSINRPPFLLGDVNIVGEVTFLDIAPFIDLLSSQEFQAEADIDRDGSITFLDIAPFIDILSGA